MRDAGRGDEEGDVGPAFGAGQVAELETLCLGLGAGGFAVVPEDGGRAPGGQRAGGGPARAAEKDPEDAEFPDLPEDRSRHLGEVLVFDCFGNTHTLNLNHLQVSVGALFCPSHMGPSCVAQYPHELQHARFTSDSGLNDGHTVLDAIRDNVSGQKGNMPRIRFVGGHCHAHPGKQHRVQANVGSHIDHCPIAMPVLPVIGEKDQLI